MSVSHPASLTARPPGARVDLEVLLALAADARFRIVPLTKNHTEHEPLTTSASPRDPGPIGTSGWARRAARWTLTDWENVGIARLNHLTLFVRDRSTASDWYVRNLNLEVEFEVPETATTAVRDPADFTIFLTERPSAEDAPRCVLYFQVDDVDAEYQRLQQSGAKVTHPPRKTPWGYGPEVIDPDGHVIRLWDQRSVT